MSILKKDFVKKLVFNCIYPAVREHVNHRFLSLCQVSMERNAIPICIWWKTEFLQPCSQKKSHIDALWLEMIQNRRIEYSVIRSSARSFARISHSFAWYALVALLARSAALIRSLRCTHSLACFAFASMEISLEHTQYTQYEEKNKFSFFFCFCMYGEDRQCRVRF